MKLSKYAWIVQFENVYILYKCHHEIIVAIDKTLKDFLEQGDWSVLNEKHPTFFSYLLEKEFIIDEGVDESENVVKEWESEDADNSVYNIIINPTMDCNMRCWYCYEKHEKGSMMSEDMVSKVMEFTEHKIKNIDLKNLNIGFFGGEPLLFYKNIIHPMLEKIFMLCKQYNVKLAVGFTTNGYLLSEDVLKALKELDTTVPISFQISLDGNETLHNKTKFLSDKRGTYLQILENIKTAVALKFNVLLRCNCTLKNISSFIDVAKDLSGIDNLVKQNVTIDLQHVWQDGKNDTPEYREMLKTVRTAFNDYGFRVKADKAIAPERCYADKDHGLVINYNGDIFSCTARTFKEANREGIMTGGAEILWNDKRSQRMAIKYGNNTCQACNIFPLCHGRCSQYKMDSGNVDCVCQYNEAQKRKLIEERIQYIINDKKFNAYEN